MGANKKDKVFRFLTRTGIGYCMMQGLHSEYPAIVDSSTGEELFNLDGIAYFDNDDWTQAYEEMCEDD